MLTLFRCFQDCYCYSNSDIMHHVTKYCNMIGPHCTVWQDMACIHSSPDPSHLFVEVGLACETSWDLSLRMNLQVISATGNSRVEIWLCHQLIAFWWDTVYAVHQTLLFFAEVGLAWYINSQLYGHSLQSTTHIIPIIYSVGGSLRTRHSKYQNRG